MFKSCALAGLAILSHAPGLSACELPARPSPERSVDAFLSLKIAVLMNYEKIFPLCGSPRRVRIGRDLPDVYELDEEGRPLSHELSGIEREVFLYKDGRLVEAQRFKADGSMRHREVYEWSGNTVFVYQFSNGSRDEKPYETYVFDRAGRTLRSDISVFTFDARWGISSYEATGDAGAIGRFDFVRDAEGRIVETWVTRDGVKRLAQRHSYSGTDSHGNATRLVSEKAVDEFGTTYFKPYGNTPREITYW